MADIAILVAEEYERRVRNSRKNGVGGEEIDFLSYLSVLGQRLEGYASWVKKRLGEEKTELVKFGMEPKSQTGLAAINGLFSA